MYLLVQDCLVLCMLHVLRVETDSINSLSSICLNKQLWSHFENSGNLARLGMNQISVSNLFLSPESLKTQVE